MTGDKPLRNAAQTENVECHGLLWIYDELHRLNKISAEIYKEAMEALVISVQEGKSRLPMYEIMKRLNALE